MATSTLEALRSSPSTIAAPSNSLNEPRTLVTIAWRATKPIRVWVGSRVQVPVRSAMVAGVVGVVVM